MKCVLQIGYDENFLLTVEDAAKVFAILNGAAKVRDAYYGLETPSHYFSGDAPRVSIVQMRGEPITKEEYETRREERRAREAAEELAKSREENNA